MAGKIVCLFLWSEKIRRRGLRRGVSIPPILPPSSPWRALSQQPSYLPSNAHAQCAAIVAMAATAPLSARGFAATRRPAPLGSRTAIPARPRQFSVRASGPSSPPADIQKKVGSARAFLLDHASGDADDVCLHKSTPDVEKAVTTLISSGASLGLARRSIAESEGLWAVFYAPHVQKLTELTGVKFGPLRYKLTKLPPQLAATVHAGAGSVGIETNVRGPRSLRPRCHSLRISALLTLTLLSPPPRRQVRFEHPILGVGWLNGSGSIRAVSSDEVSMHKDNFWVDLKTETPRRDPRLEGTMTLFDKFVTSIARIGFLEARRGARLSASPVPACSSLSFDF